jgi:hypothetical protein
MAECYGEALGMRISRKIVFDYLKGRGYLGELKNVVGKISALKDLETYLEEIRRGPGPRYGKWLNRIPTRHGGLLFKKERHQLGGIFSVGRKRKR